MTIHTGDGDGFLDNCEQATLSFDVTNTGAASQTNVRVTDVRLVSHPQIFLKSFNPITPSPDLAVCATGSASFDLVGGGLSFGDTVVVEVDLSSDELSPSTETATFSIDDAESDFQFHTSKTWDFESDLEGWTLIQGTFTRSSAGGGAGGSSFYVRSSSSSPLQCDQIRSPVMKLSATSTMTLYTNFDIESFSQGKWWDRANIGVIDNGVRSQVEPDSGRLYNASGSTGFCVTANQEGWADSMSSWASSGFSTSALGMATTAGTSVQLDVAYGTDSSVSEDGFQFDRVTVTNVQTLAADAQSDTCPSCQETLNLTTGDWRQLEFPATTNGIPRFFRADPDHEGMVKDQQVRRLVKLKKNEKTLTMAAAKAGMSRKTARKYLKSGKLPSQCQPERYWRTRSDPFESVWPEVKEILKRSPTVEAKAVFDHLCRQQEGAFQQGQLRTLQRRIKQWKAEYGEAKEVMFPQKYQPGHQAQSDFTFMGRLGVTIQGQPFPHLLYHFVLAYSNWEATTLCFSESFESLSLGLQNALWELGALPEEHRTDRLSAAVKNLKREEFTERYQALLRHFGMRSSRTQAGKAHENGDVEQSHHRLKRAIEQELLLRCSRDFSSREEYEGFVAVIVSRRNAARQKRLGEELAVMRPLPARRLDDFTRQWVRVSPSSTIRVRHNTYSVDSRLIGERVQVRVWADQVEVYYGGRRQARMPRLRGEGKHRIDYRHVIHSLVRKPGAFTRYRWREDLFPGILFRVAYDELRRDCPATADRQYLKILEVAAQEGEQRVREALQVLIERGQRIRFEALRECLVDPVVEPWEVMVEKMDVGLYDTLLENREVRS